MSALQTRQGLANRFDNGFTFDAPPLLPLNLMLSVPHTPEVAPAAQVISPLPIAKSVDFHLNNVNNPLWPPGFELLWLIIMLPLPIQIGHRFSHPQFHYTYHSSAALLQSTPELLFPLLLRKQPLQHPSTKHSQHSSVERWWFSS